MTALGDLGKKYKEVPIQSHISENKSEVAWVKTLHPNFDSYSRVRTVVANLRSVCRFFNSVCIDERCMNITIC